MSPTGSRSAKALRGFSSKNSRIGLFSHPRLVHPEVFPMSHHLPSPSQRSRLSSAGPLGQGTGPQDGPAASPITSTCPGHGPLADLSSTGWLRPGFSGVSLSLHSVQFRSPASAGREDLGFQVAGASPLGLEAWGLGSFLSSPASFPGMCLVPEPPLPAPVPLSLCSEGHISSLHGEPCAAT